MKTFVVYGIKAVEGEVAKLYEVEAADPLQAMELFKTSGADSAGFDLVDCRRSTDVEPDGQAYARKQDERALDRLSSHTRGYKDTRMKLALQGVDIEASTAKRRGVTTFGYNAASNQNIVNNYKRGRVPGTPVN